MAVHAQITDSVTQANVQVTSLSLPQVMSSFSQTTAQSIAKAANNATTYPRHTMVAAQAATTMGIVTLYSIDTASTGLATKAILGGSLNGSQSLQALTSLPREGFLGGVGLLMFDIDGLAAPFADHPLITDPGHDHCVDQDQNLILSANHVRTVGNAPFAATEVGFVPALADAAVVFVGRRRCRPSARGAAPTA